MIKIRKSKSADTRSEKNIVDKDTLIASSCQHINDVCKAFEWMRDILAKTAMRHDYTKLNNMDEFHEQFVECQKDKSKDFCKLSWYQRHITEERHHLNNRVPEDVNMFDLLERIASIS